MFLYENEREIYKEFKQKRRDEKIINLLLKSK
jgi:hypothetical protein